MIWFIWYGLNHAIGGRFSVDENLNLGKTYCVLFTITKVP